MILLRLFWEFFKTGMFSVGGGLATLPFIYDISDKTGWFTHQQIADMIAVAESTPGPIGINMATYVGFTTAGAVGSLIATLGIITPDIIIILIIASFLKKFRESKLVDSAFYGLRPASAALIAAAGWSVVKISLIHLDAASIASVTPFPSVSPAVCAAAAVVVVTAAVVSVTGTVVVTVTSGSSVSPRRYALSF